MAHQPIAIDGAGADGEGAVGVESDPSNDHGGAGGSTDQVVVPSAPPHPSARDKVAVCYVRRGGYSFGACLKSFDH